MANERARTCLARYMHKTSNSHCYVICYLYRLLITAFTPTRLPTWSCVKRHHKHGHDLVFFLPLILRREERNVGIWNEMLPNNHRLRTARTSIPSGDNSCYAPRRLAAGDGVGAGTPPWTKRVDRRCAKTVWLRTFLRRRVVFSRRWRRRCPLFRIVWWNLLPVQQRGSVRLFYHGGGGVTDRFSGGLKCTTKVCRLVQSNSLNTPLEPDHYFLLLASCFLCICNRVTSTDRLLSPSTLTVLMTSLLPPTCLF